MVSTRQKVTTKLRLKGREENSMVEAESSQMAGKNRNENTFKKLLSKVQVNRKRPAKTGKVNKPAKSGKKSKSTITEEESVEAEDSSTNLIETNAQFEEEGNVIDMGISEEQRKEFPSQSEEENSDSEEEEFESESTNNNATKGASTSRPLSAKGSAETSQVALPAFDEMDPEIEFNLNKASSGRAEQTLGLLQSFMIKKGIIKEKLSDEELQELLTNDDEQSEEQRHQEESPENRIHKQARTTPKKKLTKDRAGRNKYQIDCEGS